MRTIPLSSTLLTAIVLLAPLSASARFGTPLPLTGTTSVPPSYTPTDQEVLWETECRASIAGGEGDLEAAMVTTLRDCINDKRRAQHNADTLAKDQERNQKILQGRLKQQIASQQRRTSFQQSIQDKQQSRYRQEQWNLQYRNAATYYRIRRALRTDDASVPSTKE